jgi:hypothetical protein
VNGGANPAFQWIKNGMNTGSNSPVFTDNTLSEGDVIRCRVTTSTGAVATSNSVTMSVTASVTPAIFISTATTTICAGAGTDFHAVYTNGGSSPAFQWQLNGQTVGNGTNWMSSQLDRVMWYPAHWSSNATCTTQPTANSNIISMTVMQVITPAVSISASRTSVCAGEEVVVTATPENGGNTPGIDWLVNGIQAGSGACTHAPRPCRRNDHILYPDQQRSLCNTVNSIIR